MEVYEKALKKLLIHEGGYSNHSADRGGETYKGITKKYYGKWDGWAIIDAQEDKEALDSNKDLQKKVADFYYTYYWHKLKCDQMNDPAIAEMIFSTGVNAGKKLAVKKMQRILGVTVDGLIGQNTLRALNSVDINKFIYQYVLELIDFYVEISSKGSNHLFLKGWCKRALSFYYATLNS